MSRSSEGRIPLQKAEFVGKVESADNISWKILVRVFNSALVLTCADCFRQIISDISIYYDETHVRARFIEYTMHFARPVARYEKDALGLNAMRSHSSGNYSESSEQEHILSSL